MHFSRRRFLGQSTLLAAAPVISGGGRQHLALLGDSIFDNAAYVGGRPDVIAQVRSHLPQGWDATLHAVDGATTRDVPAQLARVPPGATHLVMSAAGGIGLRCGPSRKPAVRMRCGFGCRASVVSPTYGSNSISAAAKRRLVWPEVV